MVGVRARLLGLVLIPSLGATMLGYQELLDRRSVAGDAHTLAAEVTASVDALEAFVAANEEYRLTETIVQAQRFGLSIAAVGGLLGIDVRAELRETRERLDQSPNTPRLLASLGGIAALRESRRQAASAKSSNALLTELVGRAREAWTAQVGRVARQWSGVHPNDVLPLAVHDLGLAAELYRLSTVQLAAASAALIPDGGFGPPARELADVTTRFDLVATELLATAQPELRRAAARARHPEIDTALTELAGALANQADVDLAAIARVFRDALGRDGDLRRLTEEAANAVRDQAVAVGNRAEEDYRRILVLLVVVLGGTLTLAVLVAGSIVGPLSRLEQRARQVSDGDLEGAPLPLVGPREAAVLAGTLNDAVANLRAVEQQASALAAGNLSLGEAAVAPGKLAALLQRSVDSLANSIREREELQQLMAHEAAHDALTGLANRRRAITAVADLLASAPSVGVLFIDLDGFKALNDDLGHAAGDEVLVAVADRLQRSAPIDAVVARLGGDEFVVACPATEPEAEAVAARIMDMVGHPLLVAGVLHRAAASIGIAISRPGASPDDLLRWADTALREAKRVGRGRAVVLDDELRDELDANHRLESDLRQAIIADRLQVHYQPVVDLDTGTVRVVEALVRWPLDDGTLVAPDRFIPVAERSGLVTSLDQWVLRHAAQQVAEWRRGALPGLRLAVNVSARTLLSSHFVADVCRAASDATLPIDALEVEVTETALLHDVDTATDRIGALRARGVRISIDDFGTGYTSVSELRRLPVDTIKIDRSFVQAMHDPRDHALVDLLIHIGEVLDIEVVAEGVETDEQLEELRRLGCHLLQGYLLGRPRPASEVCGMGVVPTADTRAVRSVTA